MTTGITPQLVPQGSESLEQLLEKLRNIGKVNIHSYDDRTWSCSVEMVTKLPGSDYKVRSSFDHHTARSAVEQCAERVNEAIQAASHLLSIEEEGNS